jgi:hypothetical protein
MSEGRALRGSGGMARVAAWEAMGPRQFPPTHLTPPWWLLSASVKRLAVWQDNLIGFEASVVPPPPPPLAPGDVCGEPDGGSGWCGYQPGRLLGLGNSPSLLHFDGS